MFNSSKNLNKGYPIFAKFVLSDRHRTPARYLRDSTPGTNENLNLKSQQQSFVFRSN